MREDVGSLSKTTKLLLLDSLLQEVCIESGSDGSLALSSLGLSVCLVSHNLLYSGLKKAHLRIKLTLHLNGCLSLEWITHGGLDRVIFTQPNISSKGQNSGLG